MKNLPQDAAHWDSGDWIEWSRRLKSRERPPCTAAAEDPKAKALSVFDALLHAARSHHKLTGAHLPIYPQIAALYCAIHHDAPLTKAHGSDGSGLLVRHIPPHSESQTVTVDTTLDFRHVAVVRVSPDFTVEARMMPKSALPATDDPVIALTWSDLPQPDHI